MAKKTVKNPVRTTKSTDAGFLAGFDFDKIIPQKYHIPLVMGLVVLLYLVFLSPLFFGGKTFQSGDILASESMQPYVNKARDGFTLWNPYIFMGMPAYALSTGYTWFNVIYVIFSEFRDIFTALFGNPYVKWTFYLIVMAMTAFFFMRHFTKNTLISLFTAFATALSTGIIVFLYIGHVTKLTSLCMFPLLFLLLFRAQEKLRLTDFFILIITWQLLIQGFHVQIIFYTGLAVAVYFIYYFLHSLVKKNTELRNNLLKSAGLTIFAALVAIAIQSDNLTQIYEYTPHSTRGTKGIVELEQGATAKSESDYYTYHTDWSFSPGEVMTFIFPSLYGFGNAPHNINGQEYKLNTYFGQMRFVDVAMYMGVVVFLLGLFAIITMWKYTYIRFFTILAGIALLISFGRNLPILFDPMFYYFPYFDKFRVPSMILVLVQMIFPVLAGLGLYKIYKLKEESDPLAENLVKYGFFTFAGLFVLSILLSSSVASWFTGWMSGNEKGAQLIAQYQQYNINISEMASDMFAGDVFFGFFFLALTFGAAYAYLKNKMSLSIFIILAVFASTADLWRISSRGHEYVDAPQPGALFTEPDYVKFIKSQNDKEPFRILNLKQDQSPGSFSYNSNFNAYFLLEDMYGYSAIKPRGYQDYMDVLGNPANPTFWNMGNVKYLIFDAANYQIPGLKLVYTGEKTAVYENELALPRLFFVQKVDQKDPLEVLKMVKDNKFRPDSVAFTHDVKLNADVPDSTVSLKITKYLDERIEADVKTSGNNFLFLSNSYHSKGWKAYVDGNPVDIYKTNHNFMGIIVPKGSHKVIFEFAPTSFTISVYTAFTLSSVTVLGLILSILFEYRKKKKAQSSEQ